MKDVQAFLKEMELEVIEKNIFRGQSHDVGSPQVFGGQVLSQSLHAAMKTVGDDRCVHSMHGYFILPGDKTKPVVYDVDHTRDGGSFTTRRVSAIQNGRTIFISALSFQKEQEGLNHQIEMPEHTPPGKLMSDVALMSQMGDKLPESMKRYLRDRPIEFRPENPLSFILPEKQEPFRKVWFRANGEVPDDKMVHLRLLAYASDYNLLTTALLPHQHEVNLSQLQLASLDHAMWFHRVVKMDDWLLFHVDSPSASNTRGFTRASIFNESGMLIASVVQEGLMRKRKRKS